MVRILLTTLLVFGLCSLAFAADFSTINEDSIKAFLEIMPKYQEIITKYADDDMTKDAMTFAKGTEMYKKINALFSKYGTTTEQFGPFMQKVSMAFARVQLQKTGIPKLQNLGFEGTKSGLSEQEMSVVKQYMDKIESVLSK